jgi:cell division protein ZipA
MEMLDKTQLQWLLAGIGVIVVALIYVWGMRAHIREGLRKRRRQPSQQKEPVFGDAGDSQAPADEISNGHHFGGVLITPDHPLAEKALIDVEIRPVHRPAQPAPGEKEPTIGDNVYPVTEAKVISGAESVLETEPVTADGNSDESTRKPIIAEPPKMTVALTVVAVPVGQSAFKCLDIQAVALDLGFQLGASGLFERCADSGDSELIFSMAHLRKPGIFETQTLDKVTTPGLLLFMNLPGPLEEIKALDLLVLIADQLAQRLGGIICDERRNRLTQNGLLHLRNEVMEFRRKQRLWAQFSGMKD